MDDDGKYTEYKYTYYWNGKRYFLYFAHFITTQYINNPQFKTAQQIGIRTASHCL